MKKKTNQDIDQNLIDKGLPFRRIGDMNGMGIPTAFQCLVCGYGGEGEWMPRPNNLINNGQGCFKCSGQMPITNSEMDRRLENRTIKRLGDMNGVGRLTAFQCTIEECLYGADGSWLTLPAAIIKGHGCPMCAGNAPITNEEADRRLMGRFIERMDDMNGNNNAIKWYCTVIECGYIWTATPQHVIGISHASGCPKCARYLPISNDEMDKRIMDMGLSIKRLEDMKSMRTPMAFQCTIDGCFYGYDGSWLVRPSDLMQNRGCPKCSLGKNHRLVFNVLAESGMILFPEMYLSDIFDTNSRYHIDFYLPQHNTIIEYNGRQHYEPVHRFGGEEKFINYQLPRDAFIRDFCALYKINLVIIDGRIYTNDKLREYVMNVIIPLLIKSDKGEEK